MDLPYDPKNLINAVEIAKKYDVLNIERENYKATSWRHFTSWIFKFMLKVTFPFFMAGTSSITFIQIFKKDVLKRILPLSRSPIFFNAEIVFRAKNAGLNVGNIKGECSVKKVRKGAFGKPHDIIWGIYDILRFRLRLWGKNI
jgi:undecaprenyl-phosphate 4-deoxy-4-formamido-L-arabinose transferase